MQIRNCEGGSGTGPKDMGRMRRKDSEMEKIKNVMIVGLGALGTLYADAVEKTEGRELYVLVDEERKERYERDGRFLRGERCDFKYVTPGEALPTAGGQAGDDSSKADLIIICTKSNGMKDAVDMIEGFVGDETIIMSLMNGVTCEALTDEKYGAEHGLYSIYLGDGVKNMNGDVTDVGKNRIFFGVVNEGDEPKVELVKELFDDCGIEYIIPDDMLYAYWRKFILIDAYNQTCAIFGTSYSLFFDVPESLDFVEHLIAECIPLAKAAGVQNADALMDDLKEVARKIVPECTPSITQDKLMKRRMEVDILADETLRRSAELGLDAPYNKAVSEILHIANKLNGFED